MRKLISITLIAIVAIIWIALSDLEFGKYDSFEEVLEKGIPYKVKNVIHTQNVDGITVVIYTTEPDHEELPFADYDALAAAFLEGNDDDGWENIGPSGWDHYDNANMTVYIKRIPDHDRQGNTRSQLYAVFGEINNQEIATIELISEDNKVINGADIISKDAKRYYFQVGYERFVRGLSEDGDVIDRQAG